MSRLALHLLGSPEVHLDDKPLILKESKALALLVYLAVTRAPHQRESLSTLFWSEHSPEQGRANLRHVLWVLRKAIGDGWLDTSRTEIGLRQGADVWTDVTSFQSLLAQDKIPQPQTASPLADVVRLEEAVALYRGDFLAGFTLADSPAFDDWQFFQAESARQSMLTALDRLVAEYTASGALDQAIGHARHRLSLDNLHEPAHRTLMRLYARTGRQAAALRQAEECARLLDEELGVEPEAETLALAAAIRAREIKADESPTIEQSTVPVQSLSTAQPEISDELPVPERPLFVGRAAQLAQLEAALAQALSGQGQLRLITGEAGAGKSALITEFVQWRGDVISAIGSCDAQSGQSDPYLPFREIFAHLISNEQRYTGTRNGTGHTPHTVGDNACRALLEEGAILVELFVPASAQQGLVERARSAGWQGEVPSNVPATTNPPPVDQSRIFEQAVAVLQAIAIHFPLILVLEDLHWADRASLGLLFRLVRQSQETRLLILGSYRAEEMSQNRQGEAHPLVEMLAEMQRNLGDISIDLESARAAEGQAWVDGVLDAESNQLPASFRQALYGQTGGHPLFVVELLQDLKDSGALVRDRDGAWVMGAGLDWQNLPARVEGAIAGRMAHLDEEQRWWLTIASVMGEHFLVEVVARVAGIAPRQLAHTLSRVVQSQHQLVEAEGVERLGDLRLTRYRFRHNLMQVYLYEGLDEVQRVYLHEDTASALATLYGEQVDQVVLPLARHYLAAGITQKAIDYLILAGEQAVQLAANEEALEHFTQAQTLLHERLEKTARQGQALKIEFNLGKILSALNGVGTTASGEAYHRALLLSRQLGETQKTIEILYALTEYAQLRADLDMAQCYGHECLQLAETIQDPVQLMEINRTLGAIAHWQGQHATAAAHGDHIIAFYRQHRPHLSFNDAFNLATTLAGMSTDLIPLGYPDRALRQAQEGLALIRAYEHHMGIATCLIFTAYVHLFRGDWQLTVQYATEAIDITNSYDFYQMRLFAEVLQGVALTQLGQTELGINQVRQAIAGRKAINTHFGNGLHLACLAEACGTVGRVAEGLDLIDEGLALIIKQNERPQQPKVYRIKGDLLLLQTLPPAQWTMAQQEAETCFRQAIELAQSQGAKLWEARALASLCRLHQAQGRDEGCRQQLANLYAWFSEGFETEDLRVVRAVL